MKNLKPWLEYKNKKVLIMGLGIHGGGLGSAEFFAKIGARVLVTDLKKRVELRGEIRKLARFKNISYILGHHRHADFKNADLIIKNPGVHGVSPYLRAAEKNNVPIETEISLFFKWCKNPIIGVTGTKGKSTTVHFLRSILKTRYRVFTGGNIGVPVLQFLPRLKPADRVLLELSSWQLESVDQTKKSPHIAVITNIQDDHLNTYKNFRDYVRAKKSIFLYQKKNDFLFLHKSLAHLKKLAKGRVRIYGYSKKFERRLRASGFSILGKNAVENALSALLVARALTIPKRTALRVLSRIQPLFGRLQKTATKKGVLWINDTCSTAPFSTIQSIVAFPPKKVLLIAGGTDKNLDYKDLAKIINRRVKKLMLLSGSATEKLKKFLTLPYVETTDLRVAMIRASKNARRGDIVLFSPGAASFELFRDEFERGHLFCKLLKKI